MITYIIRRFFQTVAFVLFMWLLVYTMLVILMPDGPYTRYKLDLAGRSFSFPGDEPIETLTRRYNLDTPWPANFFLWLFDPNDTTKQDPNDKDNLLPVGIDLELSGMRLKGSGVLTGNFGVSPEVLKGREVGEAVSERWSNTLALVSLSLLVAVLAAVPLGIVAAINYRRSLDHIFTFFSFAGFSIPAYALGVMLMILLAVVPYYLNAFEGHTWIPYLPPGDVASIDRRESIINRVYHLALPVATLTLPQIAFLSRQVRFSMLEILKLDYIRTAWAKGVSGWNVLFNHALRNALIPIITSIGLLVPLLVSGAILVETVFAYPGLGQLFFRSVGGCLSEPQTYERICGGVPGTLKPMDVPLTLALTLLMVAVVAFSNMLTDILYSYADPRINYSQKSRV